MKRNILLILSCLFICAGCFSKSESGSMPHKFAQKHASDACKKCDERYASCQAKKKGNLPDDACISAISKCRDVNRCVDHYNCLFLCYKNKELNEQECLEKCQH